jgi:hypothetical protein
MAERKLCSIIYNPYVKTEAMREIMMRQINTHIGTHIDADVDPTLTLIIRRPLRSSSPQNNFVLNHLTG